MTNTVKDKFMRLLGHLEYQYCESHSIIRENVVTYLMQNGATVLPVKVGDTVYTNFAMRGWYFRDKDRPYSARVCFIGLNDSEEMGGGLFNVVYGKHDNMMQFRFSDIGKSVFLTKEEAEQHLATMRGGADNA